MFPPATMTAPVPMYASTVGFALAVDCEAPMPMRPPETPWLVASASGSALAEMWMFDVVRICELAAAKDSVHVRDVQLYASPDEPEPDEFLIASELLAALAEAE